MNFKTLSRFCVVGFLVWIQACAGNPLTQYYEKPYFKAPQAQMTREDRELFDRALFRQENNRIQASIKVWKQFLQKHPRSFEAHNNLGLVYFEDDQVDSSISEFETALSLEPNDSKIKKNLVRVLKFKSTMLNEARDYNGAVDNLKRAQEFSPPEQKEKIGFILEKFEDKVFEQAKQTNTLEAYEGFLARFPNSGAKADEARTKIAGLKPVSRRVDETALDGMQTEDPSTAASLDEKTAPAMDSMPESGMEKSAPENMEQATSVMEDVIQESADKGHMDGDASTMKEEAEQILETAEKTEASSLIDNLDKGPVPEQPQEAVRSVERPIEIATQPEPKPSTGTDLFPVQEPPPEVASLFDTPEVSQPAKKIVEIVTRFDPLRVREEPTLSSRVLATVDKGSQFPFVTERNGWYKVEFSAGQLGWVSKKFSRLME
jgi:tetratricopeptide (TPR) repeat protein